MRDIAHALAHCADRYTECPIYRALLADELSFDESSQLGALVAAV